MLRIWSLPLWFLVGLAAVPGSVRAAGPVTPPFTQCPAAGADTSCAILIIIDPAGGSTVKADPSQGPVDFIEDTLIGVQNNSNQTILSLKISSSTAVFGFDGDGLCSVFPRPAGCPFGPTGYEGPNSSFSDISSNYSSGTVNFIGGIPPGGSAYFSLEEALAPTQIIPGVPQITATFLGASGSPTNPTGSVAEPINTATGNYYLSHVDLTVPGKGLAFAFIRYYNSQDSYSGPLGVSWTHSYNVFLSQNPGGVVTIKEADGHEIAFAPSGANFITATKGVFDILKKNPDGSFTLTRKNQTRLNFSPAGKLNTVVDRNGNTQTMSYDAAGKLVAVLDTAGRTFDIGYDANGRIVSLADPLGRILRYTYDGSGNLVSFANALGGVTQYSYDAAHRMTSATDPRGNIYLQNTYDAQGRVVQQKNARDFITTLAYNTPSSGVTTITGPLGNATKHTHDASLRLLSITDALGGVTAYTYAANNLKTAVTDPLGHTQNFTYDANGNLTSVTDPAGQTSSFQYDATNNLTRLIDRLGRITNFTYDVNGNLTRITDAASGLTQFTYDSAGEVLTARNPRNFTTAFTYAAAGDLTRITDALSGTVQMTYDAVGRLLTVKNQLGNTGFRAYDANNRLLNVTDPLSNTTAFLYDANGNLTRITDANGRATQYTYDATNKLTRVTDAAGGITQYAYDGNTDLISITDAKSHTTLYAYDALRRLASATDPLGRPKQYQYDAVGNITGTLDGNSAANSFAYDSLNRLISMALADGKTVNYTYDAVGNRLSLHDWRGTSTYASDVLNRVLSVTTPDGKTVGYTYDSVGNRVRLTYPDGRAAQSQYDALNRLTRVTDPSGNQTTYIYDAGGNLRSLNHPNGAQAAYTYDTANRLTSVVNTRKNQTYSSFAYTLDKVGNRTQVRATNGNTSRYTYDPLYRLTSWTDPSGVLTQWTYDPVGNRLSMTAPSASTAYSYDAADQLVNAGSTTFTYDGNGNQRNKTTGASSTNYAWDALNRLIGVTSPGGSTVYQYDGDGNRISQQIPAGTYAYLNDTVTPLPVVLNETGPDGPINYTWGLSLVSSEISSKRHYYQFDGLGSVVNVTSDSGAHETNYGYDPWGQPIRPMEPPIGLDSLGTKNKFRFTGEASDPGVGLLFLRARYYDASTGRFLSRDSAGRVLAFPETINRYLYSLGNPVLVTDNSGNFPWVTGAIGAVIGGAVGSIYYAADHTFSNFSWKGWAKDVSLGATAGGVAGVGLFYAPQVAVSVGVAPIVAKEVIGVGVSTVTQIAQNKIDGAPWSSGLPETVISSAILSALTPFPTIGRLPMSIFSEVGPNSWRLVGSELITNGLDALFKWLLEPKSAEAAGLLTSSPK